MPGLRSFLPFAILPALIVSCAHAPSSRSTDPAEVRAAIEATNAEFSAAMKRGDAAGVAACFTPDGEVLPPAAKGFVSGTAALEAYYAARLKATRFLEVEIKTGTVETAGDIAWETGTNRLVMQTGDAAPITRTGKYLVAWKRSADGRWKIRADAVIFDPAN